MNKFCLWCGLEIVFEPDWTNLFWPPVPKTICQGCEAQLVRLEGNLCGICGGKTSGEICADCSHWSRHSRYHSVLAFNRSVYTYNQTLQAMIAKWKYRGDYELYSLFEPAWKEEFEFHFSFLNKNAVLIPVPLSNNRLKERAFNQAEALTLALDYPVVHALVRTEGEKQSKKTRRERIESTNPFSLIKPVTKPAVLIDDIYTTGTTLRHAAALLKQNGAPAVYAFTLARS